MKIAPRTRLYQARLQVQRAQDRLRSGAGGIPSAQQFLDQAIADIEVLVSLTGEDDSPVAAILGEPR